MAMQPAGAQSQQSRGREEKPTGTLHSVDETQSKAKLFDFWGLLLRGVPIFA